VRSLIVLASQCFHIAVYPFQSSPEPPASPRQYSNQRSALDLNCKAHDLDNLYVVDASFFVSIAAVNPSLTIMANALRVGDHLLKRVG
jgi:GMC oxidoreductase